MNGKAPSAGGTGPGPSPCYTYTMVSILYVNGKDRLGDIHKVIQDVALKTVCGEAAQYRTGLCEGCDIAMRGFRTTAHCRMPRRRETRVKAGSFTVTIAGIVYV